MSVKLMAQIWESGPEQQAERFVLLALADFANDSGECWPSVDRIAEKTCMKERGVRQILRRLEASGWLSTEVGGGRHGCNQYRINPAQHAPFNGEKPGTTCPPAPHAPRHETTETRHETAQNPAPHAPEPSRTIKNHQKTSSTRQNRFDEFWAVYPKKVGKPAAKKNFDRAVKAGADPGEIIAGANRYAVSVAGKESGFIKHPQGWLTDGRWSDEVSPQPIPQQSDGGERRSFLRKIAGAGG